MGLVDNYCRSSQPQSLRNATGTETLIDKQDEIRRRRERVRSESLLRFRQSVGRIQRPGARM